METVTLKEMLTAGVHFGHKRARWNPKMEKYIFATKNGVSIINLEETQKMLEKALEFLAKEVSEGKKVVFVTSKRQARDVVKAAAESCEMPYVTEKWRGGTITNYEIVSKNFKRIHELSAFVESEDYKKLPTRDQIKTLEQYKKLERIFGGLKDLKKKPDILFLVGAYDEKIALKEAVCEKIPVVALVDTNSELDGVDWPIPANDDATKAIALMVETVAKVIKENKPKIAEEK